MILNYRSFLLNESDENSIDLSIVIDYYGDLYNGLYGRPSISGIGFKDGVRGKEDGANYLAGIKRSDNMLFYSGEIDDDGYILANNKRVEIPEYVDRDKYGKWWKIDIDYSGINIPYTSGWVNVKIDRDVVNKIRKYSIGLRSDRRTRGVTSLKRKLLLLNDISSIVTKEDVKSIYSSSVVNKDYIRRIMSGVMILRYLKEIKDNFTPSSSGFLFESFVAGLLDDGVVKSDNSEVDVYDNYSVGAHSINIDYQLKLFDSKSSSIILSPRMNEYIFGDGNTNHRMYFIIGLKSGEKIDIYILDIAHVKKYKKLYLTDHSLMKGLTESVSFSVSKIKENTAGKFVLNISNLDAKIELLADNLKSTIESLYTNISELQYNVDSILTGVEEKSNKILSEDEFEFKYNNAKVNLDILNQEIKELGNIIDKRDYSI